MRVSLVIAALLASLTVAAPAHAFPPKSFYFAEGTTRAGFLEYLDLTNPTATFENVHMEFDFADGSPAQTADLDLPAHEVETVKVNDVVGPDRDVSVVVTATNLNGPVGFAAARFIFVAGGQWVDDAFLDFGATTAVSGIAGPAKDWVLAEGTTLDGFTEYITLQNPNDSSASVHVDFGFEGRPGTFTDITLVPHSRDTLFVKANGIAGPGQTGVSAHVTSPVPIVVERPIYFTHNFGSPAPSSGATDAAGVDPAKVWFFAEGNVLPNWFEFLTLYNPSAVTAHVTVDYLLEAATKQTKSYDVPGGSRRTIQVYTNAGDQGVGRDATAAGSKGVSLQVQSDVAVAAERPIYAQSSIGGDLLYDGHDAPGATSGVNCAVFAYADTRSHEHSFVTLGNVLPNDISAELFAFDRGLVDLGSVTVPAQQRLTVDLATRRPNSFFGVEVAVNGTTNTLLAELPIYLQVDSANDIGFIGASDLLATPC